MKILLFLKAICSLKEQKEECCSLNILETSNRAVVHAQNYILRQMPEETSVKVGVVLVAKSAEKTKNIICSKCFANVCIADCFANIAKVAQGTAADMIKMYIEVAEDDAILKKSMQNQQAEDKVVFTGNLSFSKGKISAFDFLTAPTDITEEEKKTLSNLIVKGENAFFEFKDISNEQFLKEFIYAVDKIRISKAQENKIDDPEPEKQPQAKKPVATLNNAENPQRRGGLFGPDAAIEEQLKTVEFLERWIKNENVGQTDNTKPEKSKTPLTAGSVINRNEQSGHKWSSNGELLGFAKKEGSLENHSVGAIKQNVTKGQSTSTDQNKTKKAGQEQQIELPVEVPKENPTVPNDLAKMQANGSSGRKDKREPKSDSKLQPNGLVDGENQSVSNNKADKGTKQNNEETPKDDINDNQNGSTSTEKHTLKNTVICVLLGASAILLAVMLYAIFKH
ncbi:hypothetical protein ENBRE01_0563 [Enteropsectra breve]|nr:hypothetical protein ENBRE01_0563 [Enteropsectra breve]